MRIAVIPGDGIGIEVAREGVKVLEHLARRRKLELALTHLDYGAERYLRDGITLPPGEYDRFRRDFDALYMGAFGDPRVPGNEHARDILLGTRFELDLYVNFRPVRLYDERVCPLKSKRLSDVDFVIFRENTEGLYVGMGGIFKKGTPDEVAVNEDVNTRRGVERIVRAAFEYAQQHGKTRVCMSDKANVLRYAHDLWQRVFRAVAGDYPAIEASHMYVDALAMDLVRRPERYQVIVTCNLFGDILSDLGAAIAGGLGLAASANLHPGRIGMFEPVHGTAPDIAGKGTANPLAMILTAALMLEHLGYAREAGFVEAAVRSAVQDGKTTPELGGSLSTAACGDAVIERLDALLARAA